MQVAGLPPNELQADLGIMLLRGGTVTVGDGKISTLTGAVDLQQLAVAEDDVLLDNLKSAVSPLLETEVHDCTIAC